MPLRSLWAATSLWPVLHRLSPTAQYTVGPKTHSNLHVYKSGLSRVSHTCSLTMYLLYTFWSSFLLIRGHSFKKRCVLEPFTEDLHLEENSRAVSGVGGWAGSPSSGKRSEFVLPAEY